MFRYRGLYPSLQVLDYLSILQCYLCIQVDQVSLSIFPSIVSICWGIGIVTSFTLSIVRGQFSNLIFYLIKAKSIYYDKNGVATLYFTASRKLCFLSAVSYYLHSIQLGYHREYTYREARVFNPTLTFFLNSYLSIILQTTFIIRRLATPSMVYQLFPNREL